LLGDSTFEQGFQTGDPSGSFTMYSTTSQSGAKLLRVQVQRTNVVVVVESGIGVTSEVAFDVDLRPTQVTTNGVAISPIPNNTVIHAEVVSNRLERAIIY